MVARVQAEDFDAAAEVEAMAAGRTGIGAVVTFTGFVRGIAEGQALDAMTLEHYPEMTLRELAAIEDAARARWDLADVLILHRHGRLAPGDRIVLVATASPHRQAAFEAAAFIMDYLKTGAPFWKKETFADGSERWVDAGSADDESRRKWAVGGG